MNPLSMSLYVEVYIKSMMTVPTGKLLRGIGKAQVGTKRSSEHSTDSSCECIAKHFESRAGTVEWYLTFLGICRIRGRGACASRNVQIKMDKDYPYNYQQMFVRTAL